MKFRLKSKNKMNSCITKRGSLTFHSKLEAQYYDYLEFLKKEGEVVFYLRQVTFDLGGGVKYKCDFMVFRLDGEVDIIDVKGMRTRSYINKKKQVEELYPIKITEVYKGDF